MPHPRIRSGQQDDGQIGVGIDALLPIQDKVIAHLDISICASSPAARLSPAAHPAGNGLMLLLERNNITN